MKYDRVFFFVYVVALRLAGSPLTYEGRLEIYHDGQWGTICDEWGEFTAREAGVACYVLGFQ